jgi:hypothetical protein
MRVNESNFDGLLSGSLTPVDSSSNISDHSFAKQSISSMSVLIPVGKPRGAPVPAAADLIRESPRGGPAVGASKVRFLTTSGRGVFARKETRDGWATTATVRRVVRGGGTLGSASTPSGVTGGAGTRVRIWGCLFSFPLTLTVNEGFFRAIEGRGPAPAPAPSPDDVFSMREKPEAKAVDAGRLAVRCWRRADAAVAVVAGLRVSGSWC